MHCLVLKQTCSICYEVIVVDNASKDGSAEAIRINFPNIKLIALAENIGFGRANNLAAMHARGRRILCSTRTLSFWTMRSTICTNLPLQNPKSGIWGGRTVFADGVVNPSCWRRMTLWTVFCNATGLSSLTGNWLFDYEGYGGWNCDTVRAVDIVVGCFLLIDRDLWEELHGFDPVFFMYGEEADLCERARQIGARPTFTPTATIIHYAGASEAEKADQRIKLLAGKITVMRRHWSALSFFVGRLLYLILPLTRLVFFGTLATLLGRENFRRNTKTWLQVWRNRQSWIKGWKRCRASNAPSSRLTLPRPSRCGANDNIPLCNPSKMNRCVFQFRRRVFLAPRSLARLMARPRQCGNLSIHVAVPRKMLVMIIIFEMPGVSASDIHVHLVEDDTE